MKSVSPDLNEDNWEYKAFPYMYIAVTAVHFTSEMIFEVCN